MKNTSLLLSFVLSCCLMTGFSSHAAEKTKKEKPAAATTKETKTGENPTVEIETSLGKITAKLDAGKAPETVKNFLNYTNDKFYDGTIFHRVIGSFMIQGGGFDKNMKEKSTKNPIKNEAGNGLKNKRGTLAMARTSDINSATAQFFINVVDNEMLNHRSEDERGFGYAVFGEVTSGMDVVDKIRAVATTSKPPYDDVPVEAVVIKSIRIKK